MNIPGVNDGNTLYVDAMHLLTTTFRSTRGLVIQYSNAALFNLPITNQKRSTSVTFSIPLCVPVCRSVCCRAL